MRKTLFAALLIAAPVSAQQPFDFSIKNIMRGPELYGRVPQDVRWSADSKWIYFNWVEPGSDWRETPKRYRVRAVPGARPERVTPAQFDSAGALVTTGDRSGNGRYMAVEYGGDIYVTDMQRATTRRVTQTNARERQPQFSPDASRVYFIRDNNVFSIDLNTGLLRQHTDLRQGPEPVDSAKSTGQRGRIEQQQRDLFEFIRARKTAAPPPPVVQSKAAPDVLPDGWKTFTSKSGGFTVDLPPESSAARVSGAPPDWIMVTSLLPSRPARFNA